VYVKHSRLAIDAINARGGVLGGRRLELVPMDNKNSPQEALLRLRHDLSEGTRDGDLGPRWRIADSTMPQHLVLGRILVQEVTVSPRCFASRAVSMRPCAPAAQPASNFSISF
jgi:hypothetical protein